MIDGKSYQSIFFKGIYSTGGRYLDSSVKIAGNKIEEISMGDHADYDLSDRIALPAFIDIHTHGINGIDSYNATKDDFLEWKEDIIKTGVWAFIPTIVSAPMDKIESFLSGIREIMKINDGAKILGGRLEGPFISPDKRGAHSPEFLREPSKTSDFLKIAENFKDAMKIIDIAPELSGSLEFIKKLRSMGIIISIGHTNATLEESKKGYEAGARLTTHLYNAMRQFHQREVGIIGYSLLNDQIASEIICDFIHVSKEAVNIAFKLKGPKKMILITDSIMATGMPDGEYTLGMLKVVNRNGKCTIKGTDTIAGSTLTLDQALRNLYSIGYKLENISNMLSLNQAKLLGLENTGDIKPGYKANIVILDKQLKVKGIIIEGKMKEFN